MTKFKILTLDLHNTIYDEVMEYGLAIEAAADSLPVDNKVLFEELSAAHAKCGSDWDNAAWFMLPSLKDIPHETIKKAIELRIKKSRELILSGIYKGAVEVLKELKKKNISIYLVTEASADIAMQTLAWLGLGGVIDGVYTYPSIYPPIILENTYHKPFPNDADGKHLKKPDAELLRLVAADYAKDHNTSEKDALAAMLYVGDSKFKDGVMARDADVKFAFASYGKKVKPGEEMLFTKSREILYAVTGWDKDTLKLTQEAGKSATVDALQPDYILENSLAEIAELF